MNKQKVVIRFGITKRFTDCDMDNLLNEFREYMERNYDDKIQGMLEIGYEKDYTGIMDYIGFRFR